jgi:hypothetical protein
VANIKIDMCINVNIFGKKIQSGVCLKYVNSNGNPYIDLIFFVCTVASNRAKTTWPISITFGMLYLEINIQHLEFFSLITFHV